TCMSGMPDTERSQVPVRHTCVPQGHDSSTSGREATKPRPQAGQRNRSTRYSVLVPAILSPPRPLRASGQETSAVPYGADAPSVRLPRSGDPGFAPWDYTRVLEALLDRLSGP